LPSLPAEEKIMKKSMATLLLLALPLVSVLRTSAQGYPPEMDKLRFLVGEWKGDGWFEAGRGMSPQTFQMKQSVKYKAGGAMMTIEGLGTEGFPGRQERFIITMVFLVIAFDSKEKVFRLRTYDYIEGLTDAVPTVGENLFVWGHQESFMHRLARYTVRFNEKKQWFEIGEHSMDNGKTWHKFFEMTLDRVE
jgi:hypothetical protein